MTLYRSLHQVRQALQGSRARRVRLLPRDRCYASRQYTDAEIMSWLACRPDELARWAAQPDA